MYSNYYFNVEQSENLSATYWNTKTAINSIIKNSGNIASDLESLKMFTISLYVNNDINEIEKDALIDYISVLY